MRDAVSMIRDEVVKQKMLDHPFYQRWNNGDLTVDELRQYALEYYHFTMAFPTFVSGIHANMDDLPARQVLLENLIEEERGEGNHPALWMRFCNALGLSAEEVRASKPNEATRALITTMKQLTNSPSTHCGLASLYAYESQIPEVSIAKIDGLRKYFQMTAPDDISFFTVHAEADIVHSAVTEKLVLAECSTESKAEEAAAAAGKTVTALWAFLDGVNHAQQSAA